MRLRAPLAIGAATALALAAVASCSSVIGWASREPRDWQFIQSVGGIAVGAPYRSAGGDVLLPLDCDVSGRKVTVEPTANYSGLTCHEPVVRLQGQSVYITIRTGLPTDAYPNARCPDADLGQLPAGRYSVSYSNPDGSEHPLGSIEVPGS